MICALKRIRQNTFFHKVLKGAGDLGLGFEQFFTCFVVLAEKEANKNPNNIA
jgi:hypothetical protein